MLISLKYLLEVDFCRLFILQREGDGIGKRFLRKCSKAGCQNLTHNRFCNEHTNLADNHRANATTRGYDARWRKYRISFLSAHPLCVACQKENKIVLATVVDHIIPHKGNRELFWDTHNHQALCKQHHDIKTQQEDGGAWNTFKGLN